MCSALLRLLVAIRNPICIPCRRQLLPPAVVAEFERVDSLISICQLRQERTLSFHRFLTQKWLSSDIHRHCNSKVNTERAIQHAIQERLPIVVVINKVDRVITELKLHPTDAYFKLRHKLEVISDLVSSFSTTVGGSQLVDPVAGNVCFASGSAGWSFTFQSSAKLYVKLHGISFDHIKFVSRLWGDLYYHPDSRAFKRKPPIGGGVRSFVQFILKPLYKIYSQVIGEHRKNVKTTLAELGVISNAAYKVNVRPLMRLACNYVFGSATGFTDMLVQHIPSAKDAAAKTGFTI